MSWTKPVVALLLVLGAGVPAGHAAVFDRDGDGTPDTEDLCPATPVGVQVDGHGCSTVQLIKGGHGRLFDEIGVAVEAAAKALEAYEDTAPFAARASAAKMVMEAADLRLQQGEFCAARGEFLRGRTDLRQTADEFSKQSLSMIRTRMSLPRETGPGFGDSDEADSQVADIHIANALLQRASDEAQANAWFVEGPCDRISAQNVSFGGYVERVQDAHGLARLTGGSKVALTPTLADRFFEGGTTEGVGTRFDDGVIWPSQAQTTGLSFPVDVAFNPAPIICLKIRVAPYQDFWWTLQPPLTHPLEGYERDGLVKLEDKMRVGAETTCNVPSNGATVDLQFVKRTMKIRIDYEVPQTGEKKSHLLASALPPGSDTVGFPSWIAGLFHAKNRKLVYSEQTQNCMAQLNGPPSCTAPQAVWTMTKPLFFLATGSYCTANYDTDTFTLEDDDMLSWQPAKVVSISTPWLNDPSITSIGFQAQGYKVTNGVSSKSTVHTFGLNQTFAVYNEDFDKDYFLTGANERSALMWPRVVGTANGNPFMYSCKVPRLTRDAVSICNGQAEHAYYRVPFAPGIWYVSQGNNTNFTHKGDGAYAFDFIADTNTSIRAARGGEVIEVVESNSANCYPNGGCSANSLTIRHQDGTLGVYYHMVSNGVDVSVGQKVKRGDHVAKVGNTGYSTDPHLHFEVKPQTGLPTIRIRYELILFPGFTLVECYIPSSGELVKSNNA